MRPENAESIHSLEEQFETRETLEFSGGKVDVVDIQPESQKTEIPVVVAPGWTATPEVFKTNILKLAEAGRRTISLDSPHGIETEKVEHLPEAELRNVAALMETLDSKGIDKIDAVGHSEAGIYLTIAATLNPDKFRNLVLVDPGGMIGEDRADKLSTRFSMDLLKQAVDSIKNRKRVGPALKALTAGAKSVAGGPVKSLKEVLAISNSQIHDMLRDLKEKGIGISIIHGVDDKAFPMDRVQQIAKADQLDGFYSVKGTHNEFYLNPEINTKLVDQALDALEVKHS